MPFIFLAALDAGVIAAGYGLIAVTLGVLIIAGRRGRLGHPARSGVSTLTWGGLPFLLAAIAVGGVGALPAPGDAHASAVCPLPLCPDPVAGALPPFVGARVSGPPVRPISPAMIAFSLLAGGLLPFLACRPGGAGRLWSVRASAPRSLCSLPGGAAQIEQLLATLQAWFVRPLPIPPKPSRCSFACRPDHVDPLSGGDHAAH